MNDGDEYMDVECVGGPRDGEMVRVLHNPNTIRFAPPQTRSMTMPWYDEYQLAKWRNAEGVIRRVLVYIGRR